MNGIILLNAALALLGAAFGLLALLAPRQLSGEPHPSPYPAHVCSQSHTIRHIAASPKNDIEFLF